MRDGLLSSRRHIAHLCVQHSSSHCAHVDRPIRHLFPPATGLSARQAELLARWGYPYVHDEFRFHMTLTGPIADDERPAFLASLVKAYDGLSGDHLELGAISLMRQDDRTSRFHVVARQR